MKIPLRFQITEFDCGTVTLQNAISFLFEREDIPASLIKAISRYTLDCYDEDGNLGQGGTSKEAIEKLTRWIVNYVKSHDFDLDVKHLLNEEVNIDVVKECISLNGCVMLRTYQDVEHYVLITDIDEDYVYIWDPYFLETSYYDKEENIEIIFNRLFDYNRKVKMNRFLSKSHKDFALGPVDNREVLCFKRGK